MSKGEKFYEGVVDTAGLLAISETTGNVRTALLERLKDGSICILSCVWTEFELLFSEEAENLAPHILSKHSTNLALKVGAARMAEKLNSGFHRGAYDDGTELYAASMAHSCGCPIITKDVQFERYEELGCDVVDPTTWIAGLDD